MRTLPKLEYSSNLHRTPSVLPARGVSSAGRGERKRCILSWWEIERWAGPIVSVSATSQLRDYRSLSVWLWMWVRFPSRTGMFRSDVCVNAFFLLVCVWKYEYVIIWTCVCVCVCVCVFLCVCVCLCLSCPGILILSLFALVAMSRTK